MGPINIAGLNSAHEDLFRRIDLAIESHAQEAGEFAKGYVRTRPQGFKHRTGNLARSTDYKIVRTMAGRVVKIRNTAPYARALEKGHKRFFLRPKGNVLRFLVGGKAVFSRGHWIGATQPTYFLRDATKLAFKRMVRLTDQSANGIAAAFKRMKA